MTLHALSHRDQVSGRFVTRCGLTAYRDQGSMPRDAKVGEAYNGFATALHERDVNCPGCRINISALELLVLRYLHRGPKWIAPADRYSLNRDSGKLYAPVRTMDDLMAKRAIKFNGREYSQTLLGKSLAERNSK